MNFLRTDARIPWYGRLALMLLPVLLLGFTYVRKSSELEATDRARLMPTVDKLVDAAKKVALPIPAPDRESERRKELRLERQFLIYKDTVASFKRMGWAAMVILLAVPIGVMMGSYPWAENLGRTVMVILSMIPALALLSILFLTLGTGEVAKVALIVLGVFPVVCLDTYLRAKALPREQFFKAQSLGACELELPWRVVFPQIWPEVLNTIRLNLGVMAVLMIAGESISAEAGIGYRIFIKFYRTTAMNSTIVYVIWLTLLMFLLDAAISQWIKQRYKWLAGQ
ncbi:NitT/TauT family transport system permease protein [Haloferula luteola]|uniref:NitT/TauT family transport system permease protein n=1 Tax=Haloferula luteola TaxID=595692 RepID=A0A840V6D8_9BACT|nr:ABC transporter permease subunit [Haloferula luteola]MBB5353213.1 NitT/TauT family transport system permease protein [Haloferula luteola]